MISLRSGDIPPVPGIDPIQKNRYTVIKKGMAVFL